MKDIPVFAWRAEETTKDLSQESRSPGRDLNSEHTEDEGRVLTTPRPRAQGSNEATPQIETVVRVHVFKCWTAG